MTSTGKKALFILIGIVVLVVIILVDVKAQGNRDSTRSNWAIIPRMHSAGYFPFTGALLNHNPVADVNVFFERKSWGFFVFQSVDLKDGQSYANYLQPGLFATKMLRPNMRLRAFVGYVFGQTTGFCDDDSDYYVAGQLNWTMPGNFRVENTLLFYDLTIGKKLANRFLVEWSPGKFRAGLYVWQRTELEKQFNSTSAALTVTFPIIKVTQKFSIEFSSSYMGYLSESKPSYALQRGAFFTLAVPLQF